MSYTVGCSPAPLTITIHPRFDWRFVPSIAWIGFFGYQIIVHGWRILQNDGIERVAIYAFASFAAVLSFIRRERIEIYPDQMIWRKTYFGITRSNKAVLADVLGAEWSEGDEAPRRGKGPDYVEFHLASGSVKACFGITFDEFDQMREDIRSIYPALVSRWGRARVRSNDFTLLNLN